MGSGCKAGLRQPQSRSSRVNASLDRTCLRMYALRHSPVIIHSRHSRCGPAVQVKQCYEDLQDPATIRSSAVLGVDYKDATRKRSPSLRSSDEALTSE